MRCLFVLRDLPRPSVSVVSAVNGLEALSGSHATGLLVAEGLARRGHEVAVCVVNGQRLTESTFHPFSNLTDASAWARDGRVIWISYGDGSILDQLNSQNLRPTIWTHLPVNSSERQWLESGVIDGLITVSDTCRIPLIRSRSHASVGRIYNPVAPVFARGTSEQPGRYESHRVVYAGAAGPTKGLHRLLEAWRYVRRLDAGAKLLIAGTGRLYGSVRELGRFGIASPEFEARYVEPIAGEFGSLEAAGVEAVGLLSPVDLHQLYLTSSLGVVNMNWNEYTETFCCAATEMLATALPVFSVARGALPETIGRSGGAYLTRLPAPERAAAELAALLGDPRRLSSLGQRGCRFVSAEYSWDHIIDNWIGLLRSGTRIENVSGPWRGPRSLRYFVERSAGLLRAPWLIDGPAAAARRLRTLRAA